jgi:transketolase
MQKEEIPTRKVKLNGNLEAVFVESNFLQKLNITDNEVDFYTFSNSCRLNAVSMIKLAGSGHLGTSLSSADVITAIHYFYLERDYLSQQDNLDQIFFSSKGHDAPIIYSIMNAMGILEDAQLMKLRRLGGLPGHPEIHINGIPTNTGSLGMGISKAKGFVLANKVLGKTKDRVAVLLGDGELQEGQIWEALTGAVNMNLNRLLVVVDGNGIQSDSWVSETNDLGNLKMRVEGSGWTYLTCDGHSFYDLKKNMQLIRNIEGPVFLYCETKKGAGVSFMSNFSPTGKFYKFHSGAPTDEEYLQATNELLQIATTGQNPLLLHKNLKKNSPDDNQPKSRARSLIQKWNEILSDLLFEQKNLIVLDADLSFDTGTYGLKSKFPDRVIQCGIAEQDMVSMAGTIALSGLLPVVHSFASFLTYRATEQIFNNSTEETNIIYCGFLAGILPSAPGHSHQAVSDVGIMGSIPGIQIYEPACEKELEFISRIVLEGNNPKYIRITSVGNSTIPVISDIQLGRLIKRADGETATIITSGLTFLEIALEVRKLLEKVNLNIAVYTYPWINQSMNKSGMSAVLNKNIFILENYLPTNGLYNCVNELFKNNKLNQDKVTRFGISELPKNGQTQEVLKWHGLDSASIAAKIIGKLNEE